MKWRLLWAYVQPDPNSPEPQMGDGEYVYESYDEAFLFVERHYLDIIGMPQTIWTAESERADTIDYKAWKQWTETSKAHQDACGIVAVPPVVEPRVTRESSMLERVLEFHEVFGIAVDQQVGDDLLRLRMRLITEEYEELADAAADLHDASIQDSIAGLKAAKAHFMKELCDLLYVVLGTGIAFGMPLEEAFRAVHHSNMSKLGSDGKPIMRADGKVIKGPAYHEPYLLDLTY